LWRALALAAAAIVAPHTGLAAEHADVRPLLREALGAPAESMDALMARIGAAMGCDPARCLITKPLPNGGGIELDTVTESKPARPVEAVTLVPCDGKVQLASDALWLGPHDGARVTSEWVKDLQAEFGAQAVQSRADGFGLYWQAPLGEGSRIGIELIPGGIDPPPRGQTLRATWAARSGPEDLAKCAERAGAPK
jgi:hypothetical protein